MDKPRKGKGVHISFIKSETTSALITHLQVVDVDEKVSDAHMCPPLSQVSGEAGPGAVVQRGTPLAAIRGVYDLEAEVERIGQNMQQPNIDSYGVNVTSYHIVNYFW